MPRTKKRGPITKEELFEIRLQNRTRLNEILSTPNYMEVIGRKYFGDDWMSILDTNHYLKIEKRKHNALENTRKQQSGNHTPRIASTTLPIVELTLEGEFIKEWNTIKDWRDENPSKHYISPIQCALGKSSTAYGRLWKFKKDYENGKQ